MQLNPRLSANLPVKLTRMKVRGAIGGGPTSLLATVVAPLWGGHGPMGRLHWPGPLAMGAMGTNPMGRWPKAHWPPLGGRYTLERRRWGSGVYILPRSPRVCPPQDGPHMYGSRRAFYYRFLPIFRTFLGDLVGRFVVLEFDSHDYLSTRLFFFSEIDLQRNRYIRSEELFELSPILLLLRWLEASE